MDQPSINYLIDFKNFNEHFAQVTMSFVAVSDAPTVWLPTWIAGSYLIREFSKNFGEVSYKSADTTYFAQKTSKNTYILAEVKAGEQVELSYEVYCYDLSVRTAFVDHQRIFGNFTSLLLMVKQSEQSLCQIVLSVPHTFFVNNPKAVLASGLKHTTHNTTQGCEYHFEPVAAFDSYDYPFEISEQAQTSFEINCGDKRINHRFFITGVHHANMDRLAQDVQKICQSYVDLLGDTPFEDYTFMTMITGSDYGGLEHVNSTALISPRSDLPTAYEPTIPSKNYQRFLGLCSHEYFHAWWVKSVRPDVMMDSDLQTEAYTPLLWVFEGFTSYMDDLMLLVSKVIDKSSYFELLAAQINRYYQTDGRYRQSVASSSFDAWIKLYRPDENSTNQGVSYYNKGALVALCLDLTLLKQSEGKYRLFDVIKIFYKKAKQAPNKRFGMTTENLGEVITDLVGANVWQAFYQAYVIGCDELPIEQLLSEFGANCGVSKQPKPWGMTTQMSDGGLKIKQLARGSAASQAGLSANDVIVAIDGIKASNEWLSVVTTKQQHDNKKVIVHAFRRDELLSFEVQAQPETSNNTIKFLECQPSAWLDFN